MDTGPRQCLLGPQLPRGPQQRREVPTYGAGEGVWALMAMS